MKTTHAFVILLHLILKIKHIRLFSIVVGKNTKKLPDLFILEQSNKKAESDTHKKLYVHAVYGEAENSIVVNFQFKF